MEKFKSNKRFWDLFILILVVSGVSLINDGFEFKILRITLCLIFLILLHTNNLKDYSQSKRSKK